MDRRVICILTGLMVVMTMFVGCDKETDKKGTAAPQNSQVANTVEVQTSAETADPTKVKIGKTLKVGNLEYTIEYTRTLKKGKNFSPKESGNIFVLIGVSVKNTGSENFETQYGGALFTSLFTLRGKDHKPDLGYDVAGGTGDTSGKFDTLKEIEAGQTVSGEIQYEVSPIDTSFLLELSGEKDSVKAAEIEIPVSDAK